MLLPLIDYYYFGTISFLIIGMPVPPIRHCGIRKNERRTNSRHVCLVFFSSTVEIPEVYVMYVDLTRC